MTSVDITSVVRVGVGVIVQHPVEYMILMGLRKGSHGAGTWSFPGGYMELGEEPAETALRELKEEIGGHCEFSRLLQFNDYPYISTIFSEGKHHITLFFSTILKTGAPKLMEPNKCERWDWVSLNNLPTPLFGNTDKVLDRWANLYGK